MMTTIVQSDPAQAERALRLIPLTADLLPTEVVDSRRARKVRRLVVSALIAFSALLAVWYGLASYQAAAAQSALDRTEADAARVLRQQRAFDEVVRAQTETTRINSQLRVLLANDLPWSTLFGATQSRAATHGIQITGLSGMLTATAGPATATGATPGLTGAPGQTAIGVVTVSGAGPSKTAVANFVDALATVPGLANPMLSDATAQTGKIQFTVRVTITPAAAGGRYTAGPSTTASPDPTAGSTQAGGN